MPVRLLFLNTRDQCGADVDIHLTLMKHFTSNEAEVFALSNSEAADADEMRIRFAGIPYVSTALLPLGRPAEVLAGRSKLGKALAYGPSTASLLKATALGERARETVRARFSPRQQCAIAAERYATLIGMGGSVRH